MRVFAAAFRLLTPCAVVLAAATPTAAQLPFDGCIDRHDRPVRSVVRSDLGRWAAEATVANGEPVIYWNARANGRASHVTQVFIYLHECAHHTLGHLWKANALAWEIEADCWAAQRMWETGILREAQLPVLGRELRSLAGDDHHLGGDALVRALTQCLEVKTDPAAWASALAAFTAASGDSFAGIQGQAVPPHVTTGRYETTTDLPGTYDCEITPARQVRCVVFAGRDATRARNRHRELVKIIRAWLPPRWTATAPEAELQGIAHSFFAEDEERGTRIALVATAAHRIVFTMHPARPAAVETPPAAPAMVARPSSPPAAPDTLAAGMEVRVRVPQLGPEWITAYVTRTAGDPPCMAFALDRTDTSGRRQFAFLRGVTAIEVDARPVDGDWVAFPMDAARRQDRACRRAARSDATDVGR